MPIRYLLIFVWESNAMDMMELFSNYKLELSSDRVELFEKYYKLLVLHNATTNLTAVTDHDEVVIKHFLDSSMILGVPGLKDDMRVIDVGSGAGFPGMVLAVLRPGWEVVLLDSQIKRVRFLETVASELGLSNVRVIHMRAEEAGREKDLRLSFDLVVSRAVAALNLLLELCVPFAKDGGVFAAYKGPGLENELSEAKHAMDELGCEKYHSYEFDVEGMKRSIVCFTREGELSDRYPRRPGIPAKRPL